MKRHRHRKGQAHAPGHHAEQNHDQRAPGETGARPPTPAEIGAAAATGTVAAATANAASTTSPGPDTFETMLSLCPAPFRATLRSPPLRSTAEVSSYSARLLAHLAAFGPDLPPRAWGPLRDLAIAEIEADRFAGAVAGIVSSARPAALVDLLSEDENGRDRAAAAVLARSFVAGDPRSVDDVRQRLARRGLSLSAIDDAAHARALKEIVAIERMASNARRTIVRLVRLLEDITHPVQAIPPRAVAGEQRTGTAP